ncbi:uncharacterized protein LOC114520839 [Dendronephthya gigantea]|uniref:uncharacterized protein LOC114520839 n=1 Tax=Dendronephthya gigantea TaxID=151771 RepID=UPI00106BDB54|nr:uncharacterized protein LOC114520839 [Dendronephthya gigantea]
MLVNIRHTIVSRPFPPHLSVKFIMNRENRPRENKSNLDNKTMECKRTWIQCSKDSCGKWRVVQEEIAAKYSDIPWTCDMNEDESYNKCCLPEEKLNAPRGKKIVITKFPYEKGDIIMAKMTGFSTWPAFITPDPECNEYYDAVLNDNDEEEEFTHIHVEFFGQPRSHAWIKSDNVFPYNENNTTSTSKSKWKKAYDVAMEDALRSLPLTCEERLQKCVFKYPCVEAKDSKEGASTRSDIKPKEKNVNTKNAKNNEEARFFQEFKNFTIESGVDVDKAQSPVWGGKKIGLFKIFQAVKNHGGFTEVCRRQMWLTLWEGLIGKDVQLRHRPSGHVLKQFYERNLLDFELYWKVKNAQVYRPKGMSISNIAQKECQAQSNLRPSKKRGRPRKSLESMKFNVSLKNMISKGSDPEEQSLHLPQASTEEVMSSRKDRKRKWNKQETIRSSGSDFTSNTSLITCAYPVVIDVTGSNIEMEKQNIVPCPPSKDRKLRKSQWFIPPLLPFSEEKPMDNNMNIDQAVPRFQVADVISLANYSSNTAETDNHEDGIPPVIEVEPYHTNPLAHKNMEKGNFMPGKFSREEHVDAVTLANTCQSDTTVNSSSGLPSRSLSFRESNNAIDHETGASRESTRKTVTSEEQGCNITLNNTCQSPTYEPQEHSAYSDHAQQHELCKISGIEYVPSSNPNSPQFVPTEEDIEEDCGISIKRELEEMEKILRDEYNFDKRELSAVKHAPNSDATLKPQGNVGMENTRESSTNDVVKDAINYMLKLEDDISQLECSVDLDFL